MEKEILRTFLYNNRLKFSDIEKKLGERSNKVAYHIKNLVKKGVLIKKGEEYCLTKTAETLIPYLSDKKTPLPIILVLLKKNSNQVFLHKRKKRPFKNKLSLPGGRLLQKEDVRQATERILKQKHKIDSKFEKINSISIEHVIKQEEKLHSFVIFFVSASLDKKQKIKYTNIRENKDKIIQSDYNLIKKDINKEINIKEFITET